MCGWRNGPMQSLTYLSICVCVTVVVPCVYVDVCVSTHICHLTHIGITKERYQWINYNTGIILNFASFHKNISFKVYGMI